MFEFMDALLIDTERNATFWIVGLYEGKVIEKEEADILWPWRGVCPLRSSGQGPHGRYCTDLSLTSSLHGFTVRISCETARDSRETAAKLVKQHARDSRETAARQPREP